MKKLIAVIWLTLSASVWAAEYKFIVPNAPGGGASDTASRKLSQMYQERFGDSLTVVNIVGGQGIPAIERFKQERLAATIVISGQMVYNYLDDQLKLPYSDQDFNFIAPVGYTTNIIVTRANGPIIDLNDLIRIKEPAFGSWQLGSDLSIKSLTNHTGQTPTIIRYRDPSYMINDLVSGVLPVAMSGTGSSTTLALVADGKLKILASSAPADFKFNGAIVPSLSKKYNIPQFDYLIWLAVSPGDSPEHKKLAKNLKTLVETSEFQDYIKEITIFSVPKETIPPNESPARLRNHILKHKHLKEEVREIR